MADALVRSRLPLYFVDACIIKPRTPRSRSNQIELECMLTIIKVLSSLQALHISIMYFEKGDAKHAWFEQLLHTMPASLVSLHLQLPDYLLKCCLLERLPKSLLHLSWGQKLAPIPSHFSESRLGVPTTLISLTILSLSPAQLCTLPSSLTSLTILCANKLKNGFSTLPPTIKQLTVHYTGISITPKFFSGILPSVSLSVILRDSFLTKEILQALAHNRTKLKVAQCGRYALDWLADIPSSVHTLSSDNGALVLTNLPDTVLHLHITKYIGALPPNLHKLQTLCLKGCHISNLDDYLVLSEHLQTLKLHNSSGILSSMPMLSIPHSASLRKIVIQNCEWATNNATLQVWAAVFPRLQFTIKNDAE